MVVKRLLQATNMPYHMVVELMDGRFARFLIVPFRAITEDDLEPVPYYRAVGRCADEEQAYMYSMYGLVKAKN